MATSGSVMFLASIVATFVALRKSIYDMFFRVLLQVFWNAYIRMRDALFRLRAPGQTVIEMVA